MNRKTKLSIATISVLALLCFSVSVRRAAVDDMMKKADKLWTEKSFHAAVEAYDEILSTPGLPEAVAREAAFKRADSAWRETEGGSSYEAAEVLEKLAKSTENDRWRAEALESLAEYHIQYDAWQYGIDILDLLAVARNYWGGHTDVKLSRGRFVAITFRMVDFMMSGYRRFDDPETLLTRGRIVAPPEDYKKGYDEKALLNEIIKIADSDADRSKAVFLLGVLAMRDAGYDPMTKKKNRDAEKYFKQVIEKYPTTEWLDDAMFSLGQFYEFLQEYDAALNAYKSLTAKFGKGDSQWRDQAKDRIADITREELDVYVHGNFIPGSEIRFGIGWKNINEVKFSIYKIDLVDSMRFDPNIGKTSSSRGVTDYRDLLDDVVSYGRFDGKPVLSWKRALKEKIKRGRHNSEMGLAEWLLPEGEKSATPKKGILQEGAYALVVDADGAGRRYELLLVSNLGIVTKAYGDEILFFVPDSVTGKPVKGANVKYHWRAYKGSGEWYWGEGTGKTGEDGLLKVDIGRERTGEQNSLEFFAAASTGKSQAFSDGNAYSYHNSGRYRLYAYADRPAYRPKEEISFKGIVRNYDGEVYTTPAGIKVRAVIRDPRGNNVLDKEFTLNEYGSFSGSLVLDEKAPLGAYALDVYSSNGGGLDGTTLFRLEEYKLPEFTVSIKPAPREDGTAGYRLGDKVDIEIEAAYYFGGPVAGAQVEYLVNEEPYYHHYYPYREYSWCYDDYFFPRRRWYGGGKLLKNETITTDEHGKARFTVETPAESETDLNYRVEVRVVDRSRREIKSTANIKITRNSYYAYVTPERWIYGPGDKVKLDVKTINADGDPVRASGKAVFQKLKWMDFKEPDPKTGALAGYVEDELFTKIIDTGEKGETKVEFEPDREGYYALKFTGFDAGDRTVTAVGYFHVCESHSRETGYRFGGIQIITDKDTYKAGETAMVMLVSDRPDTWALFTAEADMVYSHQVSHIEGNVKLLQIPITKNFQPNVFFSAASVVDYSVRTDQRQLIVPPEDKFLNVKIVSDREEYRPQEEGEFDVAVTDSDGKPVSAEMSLGVVDSAVYYIQPEFAQDIRQFYYSTMRHVQVRTGTSFYGRPYMKYYRDADGNMLAATGGVLNAPEIITSLNGTTMGSGISVYDFAGKTKRAMRDGGGRGEMDFAMDEAVPSPAMAMSAREEKAGADEAPLAEAEVRTDFRSTVLWMPAFTTDKDGRAKVTVKFPDSLTTWRATTRAITPETAVGNVTHEVRTKKNIIVRLQAPRFFMERDETVISANVHNYTKTEQRVKVSLTAKGLQPIGETEKWITVPAGGEKRVDWRVLAKEAGTAELAATAQSAEESDGMRMSYPVYRHGIDKFVANGLTIKSGGGSVSRTLTMDVPRERIRETASLRLTVSPSLAANMLDALPYLADYPYGCVEQTMSRFLPSVITAKTLQDMGMTKKDVDAYIKNVLEPRGDPAHPEIGPASHGSLGEMTKAGLDRLYDFQHSDGGWGWWKEDTSGAFMTAYVVWGLSLARAAEVDVRKDVISNGAKFLRAQLVEAEDDPDSLAWMLHALAAAGSKSDREDKMRERLWGMRDKLNPYTRALFALSEHYRGNKERTEILARNLENGVSADKENGTAHWGEGGMHYRWSDGGVESTAFVVKALSNVAPDARYLEPAVKWLALNRRGGRWKNTRDTAIAVLAMADYLKATKELAPDYSYEVLLNGKSVRAGKVTADNALTFDRIIDVAPEALRDGKNTIEVKMKGAGSLYLAAHLEYFTLEEGITPAGNEIFVERRYFIEEKRETLTEGIKSEWKPLNDGDTVKSGARVKVEIILDAKNHYEYVVVEDYKPAGLEAVELTSGFGWSESIGGDYGAWYYKEFRDSKAAFFLTRLSQGRHRITYELRAEIPGKFHAMPNQAHAMYVPEIRANSAEMRIGVED